MNKLLLKIGLIISPFVMFPGMDSRNPKEILCLSLVLAISLFTIYAGELKPFKNKWFLSLIGFLLLCVFLAPKYSTYAMSYLSPSGKIEIFKQDIYNVWMFKPLSYALMYFMFIVSVASIDFTKKDRNQFIKIICYVGFFMSLYIFVQALNLDQIFKMASTDTNPDVHHTTKALLGGFLGHPTIVSAFLIMIVPFTLLLRKYFFSAIIITAILLTKSLVAIGALSVILIIIFLYATRKYLFITSFLLIVVMSIGISMNIEQIKKINIAEQSNGRTGVWLKIIEEWKAPQLPTTERKFTLTGLGLGSYRYIMSTKHKSRFFEAHNEYLEMLLNFGLVGVVLFLGSVFYMLRNAIRHLSLNVGRGKKFIVTLLISFIGISICASGTLAWQIPTILFYTAFLVGMLHNHSILNGGGYNDII